MARRKSSRTSRSRSTTDRTAQARRATQSVTPSRLTSRAALDALSYARSQKLTKPQAAVKSVSSFSALPERQSREIRQDKVVSPDRLKRPDRFTCKKRPDSRRGGGSGRAYVPWCKG